MTPGVLALLWGRPLNPGAVSQHKLALPISSEGEKEKEGEKERAKRERMREEGGNMNACSESWWVGRKGRIWEELRE